MDSKQKMLLVKYRSSEMSFAKIEVELGVSKPTLIKWARNLETDIRNAEAIEVDTIRSEFIDSKRETVTKINHQIQRIESEIENRDLSDVPTERLFKLYEILRNRLNSELAFCFEERRAFSDIKLPDTVESFRV